MESAAASKGVSPSVTTAIVGGVVTIITVLLQFVVAPMLTKNATVTTTPAVKADIIAVASREPSEIEPLGDGLVTRMATERLREADIRDLSCWQLRVLRNVPPASHGHVFKDAALARLFRAQRWYKPGRETPVSKTEFANMSLISRLERERDCASDG